MLFNLADSALGEEDELTDFFNRIDQYRLVDFLIVDLTRGPNRSSKPFIVITQVMITVL